jgi:hypothetical protein
VADALDPARELVRSALESFADAGAMGDLACNANRAATVAVEVLRKANLLSDPTADPLAGSPDPFGPASTPQEAKLRQHLAPMLFDTMDATLDPEARLNALRHLSVCAPALAIAYLAGIAQTLADGDDELFGRPVGTMVGTVRAQIMDAVARKRGST